MLVTSQNNNYYNKFSIFQCIIWFCNLVLVPYRESNAAVAVAAAAVVAVVADVGHQAGVEVAVRVVVGAEAEVVLEVVAEAEAGAVAKVGAGVAAGVEAVAEVGVGVDPKGQMKPWRLGVGRKKLVVMKNQLTGRTL